MHACRWAGPSPGLQDWHCTSGMLLSMWDSCCADNMGACFAAQLQSHWHAHLLLLLCVPVKQQEQSVTCSRATVYSTCVRSCELGSPG